MLPSFVSRRTAVTRYLTAALLACLLPLRAMAGDTVWQTTWTASLQAPWSGESRCR